MARSRKSQRSARTQKSSGGEETHLNEGSDPMDTSVPMEPESTPPPQQKFVFGQKFGTCTAVSKCSPSFVPASDQSTFTKIDMISKETSLRKVHGRVSLLSPLKEFNTAKGAGQRFDLFLLDSSGEISICIFDAKLHDTMKINDTVEITNFSIKPCDPKFKKTGHEFELTSVNETTIKKIEPTGIPSLNLKFKLWVEMKAMPRQSEIDLLGICVSGGVLELVGASQIPKRDITMMDKNSDKFTISLWRENAEAFQPKDFCCCVIRRGKVDIYQEVAYINTTPSSTFWADPDLPEAATLMDWFKSEQEA